MKTDAEKRAFLESEEGHFDKWNGEEVWHLIDGGSGHSLEEAYRIVTKCKAARERARLRKAGLFCHLDKWFTKSSSIEDDGMTRQEAIAYLDKAKEARLIKAVFFSRGDGLWRLPISRHNGAPCGFEAAAKAIAYLNRMEK
jgi:hypothetical protein